MNYDYKKLREDLVDYIGTAGQYIPMAMSEMASVEYASESELLKAARGNGFDIEEYEINDDF